MKYFNGGIMIGGKPFKFEKSQTIFIVYAGGSRPCIEICSTEAEVDSVASWKSEKDKIFFSNGLLYMTDREGVTQRVPMEILLWVDENGNTSNEIPSHPLNNMTDGFYDENFQKVISPENGKTYYKKTFEKIEFGVLTISEKREYIEVFNRENQDTDTTVLIKKIFTIEGKTLIDRVLRVI